MSFERKDQHENLSKEEQYQRLINDLKSIIEDAKAKGIDLFERIDDLQCNGCGAYEDIAPKGYRAVYNEYEEMTEHEAFIIIDAKERTFQKGDACHCLVTYTYICPVCGLYQTAIMQDEFEEEE